ncbi:hypothetical protein PVAP13_8KG324304 [Panicum virgatum]|uniref:F-box domain-containing protein n=1 Tax=Panicum virgatum TaxID=38727 RepID=A0A8T0PR36_PANVG|nr:hypothetical protein PVAP13_8KG324304 [Panicum virgatum]
MDRHSAAGAPTAATTMAGAGTGTLLSDLHDDLLRHILSFAPATDGATTALFSHRWRWLWHTSGSPPQRLPLLLLRRGGARRRA